MFKRPPKKEPGKPKKDEEEVVEEEVEEVVEVVEVVETKAEKSEEVEALKAELRALKNQQMDLMAIISEMKTNAALQKTHKYRDFFLQNKDTLIELINETNTRYTYHRKYPKTARWLKRLGEIKARLESLD